MDSYDIYRDIAGRTQGDIYIGVVGPVRTGKSTFIKKFMDLVVLPKIENEHKKIRALDELPQSAGGRTIMTTEPKFIPNEAVEIKLKNGAAFKMRMIDCVGYIVDGAIGHIEDDMPRMVMTPWSQDPMPFAEAAELGTHKVIDEHSTVGIVVTTDGSISEIRREDYVEAEDRVINELLELRKPFAVIVNCVNPESESAQKCCDSLYQKYGVKAIPINCMQITKKQLNGVMEHILYEFPLKEAKIHIPDWVLGLDDDNEIKNGIREAVFHAADGVMKIADTEALPERLMTCDFISDVRMENLLAGEGTAAMEVIVPEELFYKTVEEKSGFVINDKYALLKLMDELSEVKKEYDKISAALDEVKRKGYGIVSPAMGELSLEEPEIVKQGSRFGVRLKASAPSIHMIRADIETEVSPIVGTERQSEELIHYLMSEFESDPKKIWESNIFGKSLHELVNEGLHNKLNRMPDDAQMKLQETLQRIINEGSGGLICIIL